MPVHDWTRVEAGVFHDFQHSWLYEIQRTLNDKLPPDLYALIEASSQLVQPDFTVGPGADTDLEFYQRKQNTVAVRHVSGDRIVAMVEVVSPGNKNTRNGLRSFVEKAGDLLNKRIHLLILDLHPPGPRDPQGIHGAIWDDVAGKAYALPAGKPITLASYETALSIKAYVVQHAVGDALTDMPLFLLPGAHVVVPLAATHDAAFAAVSRRWRSVLER